MSMNISPRPWTPTTNREIADANGNVVQYTRGNIGHLCLAVNSYDRLAAALAAVEQWLGSTDKDKVPAEELRESVRQALGRIGLEQLASAAEALVEASPEIDRRIANALNIPEAQYTDSADAAMSLVPKGWRYAVSQDDITNVATGEKISTFKVEMKSPDGSTVSAMNPDFGRAILASAIRAMDAAGA